MLSILNLPSSLQCGGNIFPIAGQEYFEPVARHFRDGVDALDLAGQNHIVDSANIAKIIRHHLTLGHDSYSKMTWGTDKDTGTRELRDYINDEGRVEVLNVPKEITFTGNAKQFVDELDAITTKFPNKILTFTSVLCYIFPRSVYEELFSRGYKILLNELFESNIDHLFAFLTWLCFIGIPTKNVIILSGRYNAHPSLDTSDVKISNIDMDFENLGCKVVNYPAFFMHFGMDFYSQSSMYDTWGTEGFTKSGLLLNRAPRLHRLLTVAYLQHKNRLDDFHWSMVDDNQLLRDNIGLLSWSDVDRHFELNHWWSDHLAETMKCIIPRYLDGDAKESKHEVPDYYFNTTKFSLVTETIAGSVKFLDNGTSQMPAFTAHSQYYAAGLPGSDFRLKHRRYGFITEKTFRPMACGHPFIVLGNNNILKTLHDLGFETFGSLWDESYDKVIVDSDRFYKTLHITCDVIDQGFDIDKAKVIVNHNRKMYWDKTNREAIVSKWLLDPLIDAYYE